MGVMQGVAGSNPKTVIDWDTLGPGHQFPYDFFAGSKVISMSPDVSDLLEKGIGFPAGSPCCFGWIAAGKPRRYR